VVYFSVRALTPGNKSLQEMFLLFYREKNPPKQLLLLVAAVKDSKS